MKSTDTIFAIASGAGKAAVKICRISGDQASQAAETLGVMPLRARQAVLRRIKRPGSDEAIDRGIILWFPGPHSFSGEDLLELHFHGGRAVENAILSALSSVPGFRLAEPGEFTWRAFLNYKMELTEVEGLADLIDANTEFQRRQALGQASGVLHHQAVRWREKLLEGQRDVEGEIDFEDEGDAPRSGAARIVAAVADLREDLETALRDFSRAEIIRKGFCVVILGPPNAGKSSLINYIAKRDAAIVSAIPGTTRDLIEVHLDLHGIPVTLIDTAGIHESHDAVEQIGMTKALTRASRAQMVLWLCPQGGAPEIGVGVGTPCLKVISKTDLHANSEAHDWPISTVTGAGISELLVEIERQAHVFLDADHPSLLTNERQFFAVKAAAGALARLASDLPLELIAEDLRAAGRELETLIGRIDSEDVLNEIFSRFCIGK